MSSLADYLAKNYLSADPQPSKKSKKRKRKDAEATTGLIIADDDAGWDTKKDKDAGDDDRNMTIAAGRTADFRKKKDSAWTTIGAPVPGESDQAAADAILLSAAAETRARETANDEAPTIEGEVIEDDLPMAGLQLQSGKTKKKKNRIGGEDLASLGPAPETIYRDASGRIINVAMKRQEARRKAEEEERKKKEEERQARGDVQNEMREERKKDLEEAKYLTVARGVDDVEMNTEMKGVRRWNDPAAGFLTEQAPMPSNGGRKAARSGKPMYQGAFEPNRHGIRPGYRWDGVDRGNGFEKKWFAARNKKKDNANLEYQWQMDE